MNSATTGSIGQLMPNSWREALVLGLSIPVLVCVALMPLLAQKLSALRRAYD